MNWKQFVASIVGSLAWPVLILVIVLAFRKEFSNLIGQIKRIAAGSVKVELAEQVAAVRAAGEAVEVEQAIDPSDAIALDPSLLQMVQSFPEAALLQAFKELEGTILQIRSRLPDGKPFRTMVEVLKALVNQGYITESVLALFNKLRAARNTAAHAKGEEEMSPGEALELIRQIKLLQSLLIEVVAKLPAEKST